MTSRPSRVTISLAPILVAFALGIGLSMSGSQSGQAAQNLNQNLRVVEDFEAGFDAIIDNEMPGWGQSDCAASQGNFSAWATALDAESNPVGCDGPYPEEVTSGIIVIVDLEEFTADTPVLDLRYDYRLETIEDDEGTLLSGMLFLNVIQIDRESADILRTTVAVTHPDTQGQFDEIRVDLNQIQDLYKPDRERFSLAGETAFIEWLYFARPVSQEEAPMGAFVDNVRLEFGDTPAPTEGPTISPTVTATTMPTVSTEPGEPSTSTPTPESPPTIDSPAPRIFLPYLHGLDE
jgi:hypothetical protein